MTKKMDSGFIVYHGTSLNIAFAIASCGAILSPFESVLMKLMEAKRLLGVDVSAINHGRSIEELASLVIKGSYGPHERFRERTVCVSAELGTARVYAIQYDRVGGGIVLGVRVSEKELSSCAQGCGRGYISCRLVSTCQAAWRRSIGLEGLPRQRGLSLRSSRSIHLGFLV